MQQTETAEFRYSLVCNPLLQMPNVRDVYVRENCDETVIYVRLSLEYVYTIYIHEVYDRGGSACLELQWIHTSTRASVYQVH